MSWWRQVSWWQWLLLAALWTVPFFADIRRAIFGCKDETRL